MASTRSESFEISHFDRAIKSTGSPSSRCEELLLKKKKSLCECSAHETSYRDIVTAVIFCYIMTLREI